MTPPLCFCSPPPKNHFALASGKRHSSHTQKAEPPPVHLRNSANGWRRQRQRRRPEGAGILLLLPEPEARRPSRIGTCRLALTLSLSVRMRIFRLGLGPAVPRRPSVTMSISFRFLETCGVVAMVWRRRRLELGDWQFWVEGRSFLPEAESCFFFWCLRGSWESPV
jgi:hypothetical protein